MKELKMEIKVSYDSITYDGTNLMDFYNFAKKYNLLEEDIKQDDKTPGLTVRPKDIPNLNYADLLKWWESTGEIKEREDAGYLEVKTYNTHNSNNMPMWQKDEEFMLSVKASQSGYLNREFIHKGDTLIILGHNFYFASVPADKVTEFIKEHIQYRYE